MGDLPASADGDWIKPRLRSWTAPRDDIEDLTTTDKARSMMDGLTIDERLRRRITGARQKAHRNGIKHKFGPDTIGRFMVSISEMHWSVTDTSKMCTELYEFPDSETNA